MQWHVHTVIHATLRRKSSLTVYSSVYAASDQIHYLAPYLLLDLIGLLMATLSILTDVLTAVVYHYLICHHDLPDPHHISLPRAQSCLSGHSHWFIRNPTMGLCSFKL